MNHWKSKRNQRQQTKFLKDKTVAVTGSRRGIGFGIALEFAKLGAVVLNGTRDIDAETLAQFDAYPGEVMTFVGDVSKFDVAENFINEVKSVFNASTC